ncbi:hypothetical protein BcepSauron_138 [Burkholderia phage BcepSauron]|uniref:Uncharacterized protein n=1 Tax=Burkholderia phage BcepSauron TaxID=2530033 RepID=A0A482MLK9_9CAUD|nr:hypothetical protein H1O17_gp138 [Burkholderia phage BcepSauron]QBQ74518.1 hypothetical protein BcepSauron_138 [Burkholderia phage BcepSauron]
MKRVVVVGAGPGVARGLGRVLGIDTCVVNKAVTQSLYSIAACQSADEEIRRKTFHQQFSGAYGTRRKKR